MSWLKFFVVLVQLALTVLRRMERQRILKEGDLRTIKHLMERANALAKAAQDARDAISDDPYDWVCDKYNRTPGGKDDSV